MLHIDITDYQRPFILIGTTSVFLQIHRMWGQIQIAVFHRFAYTCCTSFIQSFCKISAIRYKVLVDKVFPHEWLQNARRIQR